MKINILFTSFLAGLALCGCVSSCSSSSRISNSDEAVPALLEEASRSIDAQDFEKAMDMALQALSLSEANPILKVKALHTIVGIDIMAAATTMPGRKPLRRKTLPGSMISRKNLRPSSYPRQSSALTRKSLQIQDATMKASPTRVKPFFWRSRRPIWKNRPNRVI